MNKCNWGLSVLLLFLLQSCSYGAEVRVGQWMDGPTPAPALHQHHEQPHPTTDSALAAIFLSPWRERERERAPGPWLCCHGDFVARGSNSRHGNVQNVPRLRGPGLSLHDPPHHHLLGWCRSFTFVFAHSCVPGTQNPTRPSPAAASDLQNPVFPVRHRCLCEPVPGAGDWWAHWPSSPRHK